MPYNLNTKTAQATGLENIGPERTFPDLFARTPVLSPSRITLENNGKIRPQPDRENTFARASGGAVRQMQTSLCFPFPAPMSGREKAAPLGESGGAGLFVVVAVLEVPLRRKVVADRGMD
jgi:hypothetical protein